MKIIIHIKNKFYEKALRRFFNYRWNFKDIIEFKEELNQLYPQETLLTDDEKIFDKFREQAFLLAEQDDIKERRISKYTRFDHIIQTVAPIPALSDSNLKLITISSLQGGAGKTAVLKHLAHFLNLKYHVCILHLFGNESDETADLSEFMLEYKNVHRLRNRYFYSVSHCNWNMAGFSNLDDMDGISPDDLYRNIIEFLSANSIDILLFEIPHPSIKICKYFIRRADYNLIIKDCRREEDTLSNFYLNYMSSQVQGIKNSPSNKMLLQNFSKSNSIFNLPNDDYMFKCDGSVDENSIFYHRIQEFARGVLDV